MVPDVCCCYFGPARGGFQDHRREVKVSCERGLRRRSPVLLCAVEHEMASILFVKAPAYSGPHFFKYKETLLLVLLAVFVSGWMMIDWLIDWLADGVMVGFQPAQFFFGQTLQLPADLPTTRSWQLKTPSHASLSSMKCFQKKKPDEAVPWTQPAKGAPDL